GAVGDALEREPAKVVAVVHGETSTGMLQPLEEIGRICRARHALLVVDAVVTLGGVPVRVDDWGIDLCSAGTQKCLGCPSGMAPITYNDQVERAISARRTPVATNYLDLSQLQRYWSPERLNHHIVRPPARPHLADRPDGLQRGAEGGPGCAGRIGARPPVAGGGRPARRGRRGRPASVPRGGRFAGGSVRKSGV